MNKFLNRLPLYVLAAVVLFASYQVRGYEGLLAASVTMLWFAWLLF